MGYVMFLSNLGQGIAARHIRKAHSQGVLSVGGQSAGIFASPSFDFARLNSLPSALYWDIVGHRKIGVAGCRKTRYEKELAGPQEPVFYG